ncbi:MAG: hypothetical protein R3261_00485 [Alphaproteobacteria bacterium]|nr:hypothetical protein [Alphaproteobacteria bacterium]
MLSAIYIKKYIIFSIFLLLLSACTEKPVEKQTLNVRHLANKAFENQNYQDAIVYFQQAIQTGASKDDYSKLATAYQNIGDWERALEVWLALASYPVALKDNEITEDQLRTSTTPNEHVTFRLNATESHIRLGQDKAALNMIRSIEAQTQEFDADLISKAALSRRTTLLEGLAHIVGLNESEAINSFRKILKRFPNDQTAITNMGLTYLVFMKTDIALQTFRIISAQERKAELQALALSSAERIPEAEKQLEPYFDSQTIGQKISYGRQLAKMTSQQRIQTLFSIAK